MSVGKHFMENDEIQNVTSATWILVQWIGSYPEDAYDIINQSDVVFDKFNENQLKIGSVITVKCGKIKSTANILQISENTDELFNELRRLQRKVLSEKSLNVMKQNSMTPKRKKARYSIPSSLEATVNVSTQTNDETIAKLKDENRKLKAELYEANKIINTMCNDLTSIAQNSQRKLLNLSCNNEKNLENKPPINGSNKSPKMLHANQNNSDDSCYIIEQNDQVLIGSGKTEIPRYIFKTINWCSFTQATRKLLMAVFPRNVLATHSLTGKRSPAFMNFDLPAKLRLDVKKVSDIVEVVTMKCKVSESMVRSAITTKCADENKMFKKRLEKKKEQQSDCDE